MSSILNKIPPFCKAITSFSVVRLWAIILFFAGTYPLSINAQITGKTAICFGDSARWTAAASSKYLWSTNDTTQNIFFKKAGKYFVTLTDALGKTTVDSNILIVNSLPNAQIIGFPYVCGGRSTTLSVASNFPIINWSTNEKTQQIFVNLPSTISVNVVDANNCVASSSVIVRDGSKAYNTLPDSIKICAGDSAVLNASTPFAQSYYWNTDDTTASLVVRDSGKYNVIVSTGQCVNYDTVYVLVLPPPQVNIGADTLICKGDTITLKAESTELYTFKWTDGSTKSTIQVEKEGIYGVVATFGNCRASDSINVGFFNKLEGRQLDTVICTPQYILAPKLPGAKTFKWKIGSTEPTLTASKSGSYAVLISNGKCYADISFDLRFKKTPSVFLGNDTILCSETGAKSIVLTAGVKGEANYLWQDDSNTSTFIALKTGQYRVLASNECGQGSDSVDITIHDCFPVFVPNAFSPNGDAINETVQVYASPEIVKIKSYNIFDRWGNQVFYSHDFTPTDSPVNAWDGRMSGKLLNPGVFVYVVIFETKSGLIVTQSGDVTLIR